MLHRIVIKDNEVELVRFFEPQQIMMSQGGAGKLVHSVRIMMEAELLKREKGEKGEEELILMKIDAENAFNSCSQASTVTALTEEPSLRHLAWTTACQLAPCHGLETRGEKWGRGEDGTTQGDPPASAQFCTSWHQWVRELGKALGPEGMAKFGRDNGYFLGYPSVLFPAFLKFAKQVEENCNIKLNLTKCLCLVRRASGEDTTRRYNGRDGGGGCVGGRVHGVRYSCWH